MTLKIEKGVVFLFHSSEDYMNCPMISEIQAQTVAWWVEKTAGTKRISKVDQREQRLFAAAVGGVNIAQQYKSPGIFAQMWRLKVCDRNLPFEVLRDFEKRSKTAISSACSVFGVRMVPIILLFLDGGSRLDHLGKVVYCEEALDVLTENFGGVFSKSGTVNQPVVFFVSNQHWMYEFGSQVIQDGLQSAFPGWFGSPTRAFQPALNDIARNHDKYRDLSVHLNGLDFAKRKAVCANENAFLSLFPEEKKNVAAKFFAKEILKEPHKTDEKQTPVFFSEIYGTLDLDNVVGPEKSHKYSGLKTLKELSMELNQNVYSSIKTLLMPGSDFSDTEVPEVEDFLRLLPSLEQVDFSGQRFCGPQSQVMIMELLERGVEVKLFDSPSFMRLSWEIVNKIPVKHLKQLKWLSKNWLAGPAAHSLDKKFGMERAEEIRKAHNSE